MIDGKNSKAIDALKEAVRTYADRHADAEGLAATSVPGLRMMRVYEPSGAIRSMYRPLVCLILQGAKEMTAGREKRLFEAGQSVIVGVDLPVIGRIVRASRNAPYLAVAVELDMAVMQAVALQIPDKRQLVSSASSPLFSRNLDDEIVSCALRMMHLIDRPDAAPVVRPAILQELHYWLLSSVHGASLRALTLPDSHAHRIAQAIELIRKSYHKPLAIEDVAAAANMSPSAFHRHFRAITSLPPLQFQKQLRLIEARRLMLSEGIAASHAAFQVGYESPSQFTREYARMFGSPPRRDISEAIKSTKSERRIRLGCLKSSRPCGAA